MKLIRILFFLSLLAIIGFHCTDTNESTTTENQPSAKPIVSKQQPSKDSSNMKAPTLEIERIDFDVNYLMGKFVPSKHKDFTTIKDQHASRSGMLLRKDTYTAFIKMYEAAKKDGVHLKIVSATRPFSHQKAIWEGKWTGSRKVGGKDLSKTIPSHKERALEILKFSSMPGSSRHHWGTDIDFNNLNNAFFEKGEGLKIYNWLVANGKKFGFAQVYTPKGPERPNGYHEEKWHWSYLPVSLQLTRACKNTLSNEMINGFKGEEQAVTIDILNNYILGINKECL